MGVGFYVPSGLVENRSSGLDLIHYVQSLWLGVPAPAGNAGQLALADWIMANSKKADSLRPSSVIERLLTGEVVPSDTLAAVIAARTDGAVTQELWEQSSAATNRPKRAARPDGDDIAAPPPAAMSSPQSSTLEAAPNCHGRLGERASGKVFTAVRTPMGAILLTSCYGVTLALDEMAATAAHAALGFALGIAVLDVDGGRAQ